MVFPKGGIPALPSGGRSHHHSGSDRAARHRYAPSDYLLIDGVCHAYLYISGYGYSTVVGKGWLTPLIEAGEGVSLSFYLVKQPREKTVNAIGQTTMINRSRMRDVGDTRQDFEELGDAIGAGLYLKEGMNREGQDFYYMHTLIEVIADEPGHPGAAGNGGRDPVRSLRYAGQAVRVQA